MSKPHYVRKGGWLWRFDDRAHHKAYVKYANGHYRGPSVKQPDNMTLRTIRSRP